MSNRVVLGIDPGSSKCGLALVERDEIGGLKLIWHEVVPVDDLLEAVDRAFEKAKPTLMVVGSGTKSREAVRVISERHPSLGILVVNEMNTSAEARARYWEYHKRCGWRKFLPATMQQPPEPYDDFAALVLVERVISD